MNTKLVRQSIAEGVGTMVLATVIGVIGQVGFSTSLSAPSYQYLFGPAVAGLTVATLVYLLGPVSGAHFNPAVSVALYSYRRMSLVQLGAYVLAQVIGAVLGFQLLTRWMIGVTPPALPSPQPVVPAMLGEFIGAFILVWAVMNVVLGRVKAELAGVVIGAALTVGATLALASSGALLNPALALGLITFHPTYVILPLLGGLAGGGLALWLGRED